MKSYTRLRSQRVFECRQFSVDEDLVRLPNDHECSRFVVRHPGAVVILPRQSDGRFLLVRQYRHPIGGDMLEFPAGTLEPGEKPLPCAQREICEEVGHAASNWIELGRLYPAPGFCDELQFGFLATDLRPQQDEMDEDEIIEVEALTVSEIEEAIRDGRFCDGKSLAFFARARLLGLI